MSNLWGKKIPYNDEEKDGKKSFIPTITEYQANSKGAVIVFAGGAYEFKAQHEGPQMGQWLQSIGITAFVVDYRVAPYKHPAQISDAMRAVRYVRHNSKKFGIDENKIAVMGFSAGGHLAGSVSVHYDKEMYEKTDAIDKESAKPNLPILGYPVIDMFEYRHNGSRQNLLGERCFHSDKELMSLYMHVTRETPPAFLWHTSTDQAVPVENTLLYASALAKEHIPFEVHIYPQGPHGLGLAPDYPHVAGWAEELNKYLSLMEWK